MKKVVKKQLKEDEFVSIFKKVLDFIQKHTKLFIAFAFSVLFIALLVAGLRLIRFQSLKKESRVVTQMLKLRAELGEKPEKVAELERMAGQGKFSRIAHLLLATYWMEKGSLEKAEEYLDKMKKEPKDLFHYQALDLKAQIHILKKDYDKAIAIYREIEEKKPKDYALDVVLFHLADALEKKGEKDDAMALYKKLQDDYGQSYYGFDASQRIRKLESKK